MKTIHAVVLLALTSFARAQSANFYVPPFQTYDPLHQKSIRLVAKELEIDLEPGDPYNPEINPDKLLLKRAEGDQELSLPYEIGQVNSITDIGDNKVVVNGMINGERSEIVVVDWKLASIIDNFICYLPEVSPDGKWIAFIKFYPAHGSEFVPRDHYMIYKLSGLTRQSRLRDRAANDRINVGETIYPIGRKNLPGDNVGRSSAAPDESSSRLVWSSDSNNFAFAVSAGKDLSLVWVTRSKDSHWNVKTIVQDTSQVWTQPPPAEAGLQECPVVVDQLAIDLTAEPVLSGRLSVVVLNPRKTTTFAHPYSEFK